MVQLLPILTLVFSVFIWAILLCKGCQVLYVCVLFCFPVFFFSPPSNCCAQSELSTDHRKGAALLHGNPDSEAGLLWMGQHQVPQETRTVWHMREWPFPTTVSLERLSAQGSVRHAPGPPGVYLGTCLQGQWGSATPPYHLALVGFKLTEVVIIPHVAASTDWLLSQTYIPNVWTYVITVLVVAFVVPKLMQVQVKWAGINPLTPVRVQTLSGGLRDKEVLRGWIGISSGTQWCLLSHVSLKIANVTKSQSSWVGGGGGGHSWVIWTADRAEP